MHDKAAAYHAPSTIPSDTLAFNGTWTIHREEATAGDNAKIMLQFTANDIYLVMSGQGTVGVSFNGQPMPTVNVNGIP